MSELSRILERAQAGDAEAAAALMPLVYDELRRLAATRIREQPPGGTLNATALVHEVYLRLAPQTAAGHWNSRGHFFAAAAEAMRRILIDMARRRQAAKRGGEAERLALEFVEPVLLPDDRLIQLDEALDRLAKLKPPVAELVQLKFFGGMTLRESAEVLGISVRTAKNWWAYAKAWLHAEIGVEN